MNARVLFVVRRRWPILLVIPLLAAGVALLFAPSGDATSDRRFSATALIAADSQSANQAAVQQAILEAEQGSVAAAVAEASGLRPAQVAARVEGSFDTSAYVVSLDVHGPSRAEAEELARSVSVAFVEAANQGPVLQRESEILEAVARRNAAFSELTDFLAANQAVLALPEAPPEVVARQEALQAGVDAAAAHLETVEATPVPGQVYRVVNVTGASRSTSDTLALPASVPLRVTMGLVFGLAGALVVTMGLERLNPRIDDPEQAVELIGAPVLAMVPVMNRRRRTIIERADPEEFRGPFAESFRSMRSHLEFRATADQMELPPRILVTSATPGEGKSTTTAFLALSYAETERPPVIVGADLRRPMVHHLFEIDRVPGLSSRAVAGGDTVPLDEIVKQDPTTAVSVVPSGPAVDRVTGLLGDLTALTEAARAANRVVLVDTAPVMVANDAIDFLVAVDWVIVVVRIGRSTQRSVKQMVKTLNLNEATIAGVVMVGSLEASDAKRYYYSYYADGPSDRRAVSHSAPLPASDGTPVSVSGSVDHPGNGRFPRLEPESASVTDDQVPQEERRRGRRRARRG